MKNITINLVFDDTKNLVLEMDIIENMNRTEYLTTCEESITVSKAIELIKEELN